MTLILLDDVTTDTTGTTENIQNTNNKEYGIVQCDIAGTATVTIQGRLSPSMSWHDVHEFTAPGATRITLFKQMRAVAAGVSGGAVRVELIND